MVAQAVVLRHAPMTRGVRTLIAATLIGCVGCVLAVIWKVYLSRPKIFTAAVFIFILAVVWVSIRDKNINNQYMNDTYVRRLATFDGIKYMKNGETRYGADMSGIAREALWQAGIIEAIRSVNPSLCGRAFAKFWWHDMDERDILKGKYDYTYKVGEAMNIGSLDFDTLLPGDMIITEDGTDMKIFMGGDTFLASDGKHIKSVSLMHMNKNTGHLSDKVAVVRWSGFKDLKK
ncbi:MAG: hypothetical protein J6X53_04500 [Abditibacteriota bacterium]|nr:hypothetical protein [Abditibacteriota bacterium]MBP5718223.1 hypothetical protein [Abditibacteriota bacterium]